MSELELRQTTIDAEIAHEPAVRRRRRLRLPHVGTILAGAFVVFLLVATAFPALLETQDPNQIAPSTRPSARPMKVAVTPMSSDVLVPSTTRL